MTKRIVAVLLLLVLAIFLFQTGAERVFGASHEHYVTYWGEVNVPNIVGAVVVDWRLYDTLGEATVLFTAAAGFYVILEGKH